MNPAESLAYSGQPGIVSYRIDKNDAIAFVNPEWDRFAISNSAEGLTGEKVISRSLWDFIGDLTTRHLYQEILARVRAGREVRFPFRCDSPDCRRFLEMQMRVTEGAGVEFQVLTLSIEPRPAMALLLQSQRRSEVMLNMCAWCKKIPIGDRWVEIEEAVAALQLFASAELPRVSHGICGACEQQMFGIISSERAVS